MKFGFLGKSLLVVFIGLIALAIISNPAQKQLKIKQLDFKVLESDELYFKNLRQYYYEKKTREDAGFNLLNLKESNANQEIRKSYFTIVTDWRNDAAYIMLSVDSSLIIPHRLTISSPLDTFIISEMNMERHQHVASKVYSALEDEKVSFYLLSAQNQEIEIWADHEERNLLKRILKDYFKLVGAL